MVKKAKLWLILYFVKFYTVIQFFFFFFFNVKEKSCNKTHFELLIQFSRFLCCIYYAEAIVTTYSVLGKS